MPRNKTFEIAGRAEYEVRIILDAQDYDHALERAEWFLKHRLRWLWKNTVFPKARTKQDVFVEDSIPEIEIDSVEIEEEI